MVNEILQKMTGEGLLLMAILKGDAARECIDAELDRRALVGGPRYASRRANRAAAASALRFAAEAVTAA